MADEITTEKTVISKTEKFIRNMSFTIAAVLIIVLIIIKVNVPSFKIWALLVSIAGVGIFFYGVYYFTSKMGKFQNEKETENTIPRPITLEQCREIARGCLKNPDYAEYAIDCLGEDVQQRGKGQKNDIYISKWRGYYSNDEIFILINMNYPKLRRAVKFNPTPFEIDRTAMFLANEEISPMKETKLVNAITGVEQTISEPIKDEDKKKEEDKDL